jgi:hypothetical protein
VLLERPVEEEGVFEPEPEEPEESEESEESEEPEELSQLAAEKGAAVSGVRPGGHKVVCASGSVAGVIACNGVLFEKHNKNHLHSSISCTDHQRGKVLPSR